jgi:hypothetical protein
MARNQARTYATMTEEERRRFAQQQPPVDDRAEQLELGDPRTEDEPDEREPGRGPGPEAA